MLLGVHVSTEGRIYEAVERAQVLGCNTMQIFSRSPQRWRDNFLDNTDVEEFDKRREKARIKPVFIHIPYLINLASPNPRLYEVSIQAYIEDVLEAQALKVDYIVTHMGSHKNTSEEAGIERLVAALNRILERTRQSKVGILLENTAGSGSWLGYKFTHQKKIIQGLKYKERVGLCFDTAHAYLAGYDIASQPGFEAMLDEIDKLIGIDFIKLIHLNDAKDNLGSHRDRHAHIGRGHIGLEGMKRIINHPKFRKIPFILETPKDSESADKINLETVRSLRY
ncbi:MAG: deoxyribonuclease IV [Candidatus Omnitrophica bacterium]|nr:deoxyribonuclease IV [Candidatus Omnitrophota bacterium]MBU4473493.1 deoxyribonuclease IV [Candidatus Omnitrophota bacterium]MCG2706912.1 deoxyribonuclease IV [Candidatus Omnitrophota bacterium]